MIYVIKEEDVMAVLVTAIHAAVPDKCAKDLTKCHKPYRLTGVDPRDKPGDDEWAILEW